MGSIWTPHGERLLRPVSGAAEWSTYGGEGVYETIGQDTANSRGTELSSGASNVKGSWTEVVASSPVDAHGLFVNLDVRLQGVEALVDVAVGSPEKLIAENLMHSTGRRGTLAIDSGLSYFLPISVPAGTRISARCQTLQNDKEHITITLLTHGALLSTPLSEVKSYGEDLSDSAGTAIDPGGTINTKGGFVEITASTTGDIKAIILAWGNRANLFRQAWNMWLFDIAIGGLGVEKIVLADLPMSCPYGFPGSIMGPFPINIPSGTRLSAQAQSNETDATDRVLDLMIYGVI